MNRFLLSFLIAFLSFVSPARADIEIYDFDKVHTQILFFVDHLGFSNSQGEFHDYEGYIQFDRAAPENSKVDIVIKTDSIDMDDDLWDEAMKEKDFFNVEQFPEMHFKSTNIEITGDDSANIIGDMTIIGVTRPMTLSVVHNKSGKYPFNGTYRAGFSAAGVVKRSDFGMDLILSMIGDEVEIMIEVEAVRREEGGESVYNK